MSRPTPQPLRLRLHGRLSSLEQADVTSLVDRGSTAPGADASESDPVGSVRATVAGILTEVRTRGDDALRDMARRFDGVALDEIEVPRARWDRALAELDEDVRRALERATANIRRFHEAQRPAAVRVETEPGVSVTRAWTPLARVGVYAPGGTASYPSSVLMGVVPARAAGVDEVVLCSPPGPDGRPPREILAACAIAGADRVFALGGAGAVAAMVSGTETVPSVDAVVGPGNRWVTEAKRQVAGDVVIDSPAGPSEVLVLADESAEAELVAMEMLAQAEHDPDASCVLVTTSDRLARDVTDALSRLLAHAPRAEIARRALERAGAVLVAESPEEALAFTDRFAPEHLSLMTRDAATDATKLRHAGTIFVGPAASVAFGDYMTGANHVLPTAGRARSFSGLSTHHFLRSFTIQEVSGEGARAMADDVALLAMAEGLPAHAEAARVRKAGSAGEEA
jgi:histidinol dehydrogenase